MSRPRRVWTLLLRGWVYAWRFEISALVLVSLPEESFVFFQSFIFVVYSVKGPSVLFTLISGKKVFEVISLFFISILDCWWRWGAHLPHRLCETMKVCCVLWCLCACRIFVGGLRQCAEYRETTISQESMVPSLNYWSVTRNFLLLSRLQQETGIAYSSVKYCNLATFFLDRFCTIACWKLESYAEAEHWFGGSLFHVVVDNDDISTRIIRYLTSEKGGRVTFMPLNRIRASRVTYPTGPDVVPLLRKLNYDPRFGPAFAQVSIVYSTYLIAAFKPLYTSVFAYYLSISLIACS